MSHIVYTGSTTPPPFEFSSVLWYCWLGERKGIWSVQNCSNYHKSSLLE